MLFHPISKLCPLQTPFKSSCRHKKELERYLKCSPVSSWKKKKKEWKRGASLPRSRVLLQNWFSCSCPWFQKTGRAGLSFLYPVKGGRNSRDLQDLQKDLRNQKAPLSPDRGFFCVHCCSNNVPGLCVEKRASSCGRNAVPHTSYSLAHSGRVQARDADSCFQSCLLLYYLPPRSPLP